jgi:CDP-paratose 2-epimerase
MGNEDQGWVAHFLIRALEGQTITLYGDGKRWHGVLYVEDLVDEFLFVRAEMPRIAGQAFTAHNVIRKLQLTAYAERQR